jgi:hypothetical protein
MRKSGGWPLSYTVIPRLAQHAKPARAVVGGPKDWPDPNPKQNHLLYLSYLPNDQHPIAADIGSPYWRKAIDLNDRRRLLYRLKYCERTFPNCLCSGTIPVSRLPLCFLTGSSRQFILR